MSAKCRGGGRGGSGTVKDEIVGEVGGVGGGGRNASRTEVSLPVVTAAPPTAPAASSAGIEIGGGGEGGGRVDSVVEITGGFSGSDADAADSAVSLDSTSGIS